MKNRYIDGTYAQDNFNWHDVDAHWKASQVAELLEAHHLSPRSICDIGCGAGGVLNGLRSTLPTTTLVGFDISPQAVALAGQMHPEVDVRLGDARQSTEAFDLALLIDVFEHVPDYLGFLESCATVGRRLICHIPLDMTALMVARDEPINHARRAVGHLHYFSKATALDSLRLAGYHVESWRYTPGTLELPGRSLKMRMAAIPRRFLFQFNADLTVRLLGGYSLLVLATPSWALSNADAVGQPGAGGTP